MPNFKSHRLKFAAQLVIPEAKHFDALAGEKSVSRFVSGPLVWKTVSAAVEFDRELRNRAVEIEEVDAARVLTTEFEFVETMVTQQTPQAFLGISGLLAELAGIVPGGGCAGAVFAVLRCAPPRPLIASFSPTGGEGVRRTVEGKFRGA